MIFVIEGCAARSELDRLDSVRNPTAKPGWQFYAGAPSLLAQQGTICLTAVDDGRHLDLHSTISRILGNALPDITIASCLSCPGCITVQYRGDYSSCTHGCDRSTRFGLGIVRVVTLKGEVLFDAVFSDRLGGTAVDVAERFGGALATLLKQSRGKAPA